jgi:hypothetical protein
MCSCLGFGRGGHVTFATFGLTSVSLEPLRQLFQRDPGIVFVGSLRELQAVLCLYPKFLCCPHGRLPAHVRRLRPKFVFNPDTLGWFHTELSGARGIGRQIRQTVIGITPKA